MNFSLNSWNENDYNQLITHLFNISDESYKEFHSKIVPEIENFIGVRTPLLRKISKEIVKGDIRGFLKVAKDDYYETKIIKGAVIGLAPFEYKEVLNLVLEYITKIDNWAVCDFFCLSLKNMKKHQEKFFDEIKAFLMSENPWIIRAGLVLMLSNYIDEKFVDEVLKECVNVKSAHYYVKMAQAWLICTCYIKFPKSTMPYFTKNIISDDFVVNKSIQKIRDSYRISKEQKDMLLKYKRKTN